MYDDRWIKQSFSIDDIWQDSENIAQYGRTNVEKYKIEYLNIYTSYDYDKYDFQLMHSQIDSKETFDFRYSKKNEDTENLLKYLGYSDGKTLSSETEQNNLTVKVDGDREEKVLADFKNHGFDNAFIDLLTASKEDVVDFFDVVEKYVNISEKMRQDLSEKTGVEIKKNKYTPATLQELCKGVISDDVNLFVDAMDDVRIDRKDKADITKKYTQKVLEGALKNNQIER